MIAGIGIKKRRGVGKGGGGHGMGVLIERCDDRATGKTIQTGLKCKGSERQRRDLNMRSYK